MPTTYLASTHRTNRFLGRCEHCIRPIAVEDHAHFPDIMRVVCPDCGTTGINLERVYGTVDRMSCDARCMGAIGRLCVCSCGGANHGGSFIRTGEALASAIAAYRATTERRRAAAQRRSESRRASREAAEADRRAAYLSEHANVLSALAAYTGTNSFIISVKDQHLAGRELSSRQISAVDGALSREAAVMAQRAAERAASSDPAPLGTQTVTGRVVNAALWDGFRGPDSEAKMLVKTDEGFKIRVTVPSSIYREVRSLEALVGRRVTFTANLERAHQRSRHHDDPSYRVAKRPRNASLLSEDLVPA